MGQCKSVARLSATGAAIALALPLLVCALPAAAQPTPAGPPPPPPLPSSYEYAVKFVCGRGPSPAGPVAPGFYFTVVNVHNPVADSKFRRKVAIAFPAAAGPITPFATMALKSDGAMDIDCKNILDQFGVPTAFATGFLVIQSPQPLDVVAVYTAAAVNGQVAALHTERVPPRSAPMIWPPL